MRQRSSLLSVLLFLTRKGGLLFVLDFFTLGFCLTVLTRMIRDQANKTIDIYLQRIRKFGSTMPDTVLPSTGPLEDSTKDAARIGTSNDNSWAGWAISSFTNKIATADGEIQPTTNGSRPAESDPARSSSVPRLPKTASPATRVDVLKETSRPTSHLNRSISEQPAPFTKAEGKQEEAEDAFDAWGAMEDDDEEERPSKKDDDDDDDPFSAAVTTSSKPSPSLSTTAPKSPTVPYDDGGEPDFAGWLAAQSKAKSKKPLPKGLNKPASSASSVTSSRTATPNTAAKPKTTVTPAKKIDIAPKDDADDDGWGEWD